MARLPATPPTPHGLPGLVRSALLTGFDISVTRVPWNGVQAVFTRLDVHILLAWDLGEDGSALRRCTVNGIETPYRSATGHLSIDMHGHRI